MKHHFWLDQMEYKDMEILSQRNYDFLSWVLYNKEFVFSLSQVPGRELLNFENFQSNRNVFLLLVGPGITPQFMLKRRWLIVGLQIVSEWGLAKLGRPVIWLKSWDFEQYDNNPTFQRPGNERGTGDWVQSHGQRLNQSSYVMKL